jgi:hypothetical protein
MTQNFKSASTSCNQKEIKISIRVLLLGKPSNNVSFTFLFSKCRYFYFQVHPFPEFGFYKRFQVQSSNLRP